MEVAEHHRMGGGPTPIGSRATPSSAEAAAGLTYGPDEHIIVFAECEQLVGRGDFERAAAVLTNRRFLLVSPAPGTGCALSAAEERSACRIINHETLDDGSMLLVLGCRRGHRCLYFKPPWKPEVELMLDAFASQASLEEAAEVDRFALAQEFAGLCREEDDEEDDF